MIPTGGAEKVLQLLAIFIVPLSNRLDVLALQIRDQTGNVLRSMVPLRRLMQTLEERGEETFQPLKHPAKHVDRNFAFFQHLPFPNRKSSFHRRAS